MFLIRYIFSHIIYFIFIIVNCQVLFNSNLELFEKFFIIFFLYNKRRLDSEIFFISWIQSFTYTNLCFLEGVYKFFTSTSYFCFIKLFLITLYILFPYSLNNILFLSLLYWILHSYSYNYKYKYNWNYYRNYW